MSELRQIEIDFDIHKLIEAERRSFDEAPYVALRRLLKLSDVIPVALAKGPAAPSAKRSWSDRGVTLPHGTELHMDYNGRNYDGTIEDGAWLVGNKRFSSPSAAASEVCITRNGGKTLLNGWIYWRARLPNSSEWLSLSSMRKDRG